MNQTAIDEEKTITTEWLESKGFALYSSFDEADLPAVFDVEFEKDDLVYLEKQHDRQQFCIVLRPCSYTSGEVYFCFEVWVQYNIGCGWTGIPNQFTEMTEYHFSLLYEAIRREKL